MNRRREADVSEVAEGRTCVPTAFHGGLGLSSHVHICVYLSSRQFQPYTAQQEIRVEPVMTQTPRAVVALQCPQAAKRLRVLHPDVGVSSSSRRRSSAIRHS